MSERVEAAAKELNGYTGDCRCHEGYTSRRLIDPDCCYHEVPNHEVAVDMLKAADSVLFSEAAIERAAKNMRGPWRKMPWDDLSEDSKDIYRDDVRAVVAALREEA